MIFHIIKVIVMGEIQQVQKQLNYTMKTFKNIVKN